MRVKWLALIPVAAVLSACGLQPPTMAEIFGTYRLNAPAGVGILTIRPDGFWEYKFDKNSKIPSTGRWNREPSAESASRIVIGLEHFQLGFQRYSGNDDRPVLFLLNLERTWNGKIRDCLSEDYNLCFIKQ